MPNVEPGTILYVVMGSTGEYSDRSEWTVLAFLDETKAQTHVELATQRASEVEQYRERRRQLWQAEVERNKAAGLAAPPYYNDREDDSPGNVNEYDPGMQIDYSGARYYIEQVQLAHDCGAASSDAAVEAASPEPAPDLWAVLRADDA